MKVKDLLKTINTLLQDGIDLDSDVFIRTKENKFLVINDADICINYETKKQNLYIVH